VGFGVDNLRPHNVIYSLIGGSLLWVGWFGFNGGAWLAADGRSGFAVLTTQISASTCAFTWMLIEWRHKGKPSVLGIISGAISGLVIIAPGAGYVDQTGAFCMGLIGGPIVYLGIQLKHSAGYDDALDAFGVHGVGGTVGGLLTGFFANDFISGESGTGGPPQAGVVLGRGGHTDAPRGVFYGNPRQLGLQLYAIVVIAGWSFTVSFIILRLIAASPLRLRVRFETEAEGLDAMEHGESVAAADGGGGLPMTTAQRLLRLFIAGERADPPCEGNSSPARDDIAESTHGLTGGVVEVSSRPAPEERRRHGLDIDWL
jgi:Amt family ammonium transporter